MAERVEITYQRLRVARDINQPCYWLLYECVEDSLLAACAWRVEHQPIELCSHIRQQILSLPLQ